MNLFQSALKKQNEGRPPVWFMRQAGRYHSHYQALKLKHDFLTLCKNPKLACEVTMGPIDDFGFDAAILFSDLLFPLEVMGMGLTYEVGPKLSFHLKTKPDLARLSVGPETLSGLLFQGEAMSLIRTALPPEKGLIGFVGGPLTLYCYAVQGSHQGAFEDPIAGLKNGLYEGFTEMLLPLLAENILNQLSHGADVMAVLDTCAGEIPFELYKEKVVPVLNRLFDLVKAKTDKPILYYSKKTGPDHWKLLWDHRLDGIGIDWTTPIDQALNGFGARFALQGNFDPSDLFLESGTLQSKLSDFFSRAKSVPLSHRKGWICGLGHGVLQKTPESAVRLFLSEQRKYFQ